MNNLTLSQRAEGFKLEFDRRIRLRRVVFMFSGPAEKRNHKRHQ